MTSDSPPSTPLSNSVNKRPIPDIELTASGRNKQVKTDPLIRIGGHFLRTVEMFILPSVVITKGLVREGELDDQSEYTSSENQAWGAWQKLIAMEPSIYDRVETPQGIREASRLLQQGGSSAKSLDTNGIKTNIPLWWSQIAPDSPPIPKRKDGRGFHNDVTGQLSCPADLDWDDPGVQAQLRQGTATIRGDPVTGANWPNFLYAGKYDPNLPWIGVLKGPLLVKAFRHVFTSPSSNNKDENTEDTGVNATRSGNAQINGMTAVTPGSIAYVATQVLFGLSSQTTFHKNCHSLDPVTFFDSIISHFQDPDNKLDNQQLLSWWNDRVFPKALSAPRNDRNSSRVHLKATRMAHRLAENTSSATTN